MNVDNLFHTLWILVIFIVQLWLMTNITNCHEEYEFNSKITQLNKIILSDPYKMIFLEWSLYPFFKESVIKSQYSQKIIRIKQSTGSKCQLS